MRYRRKSCWGAVWKIHSWIDIFKQKYSTDHLKFRMLWLALMKCKQVLKSDVVPLHYDLTMYTDTTDDSFVGRVSIVCYTESVDGFSLNFDSLSILKSSVYLLPFDSGRNSTKQRKLSSSKDDQNTNESILQNEENQLLIESGFNGEFLSDSEFASNRFDDQLDGGKSSIPSGQDWREAFYEKYKKLYNGNSAINGSLNKQKVSRILNLKHQSTVEESLLNFKFPSEVPSGLLEVVVLYSGKISTNMSGYYVSQYSGYPLDKINADKEKSKVENSEGSAPDVPSNCRESVCLNQKEFNNENPNGLIEEQRTDRRPMKMYSTHFEATSCRSAVPSFDQPDMKATFKVSLVHPQELVALSNMPIDSYSSAESQLHESDQPFMDSYIYQLIYNGKSKSENEPETKQSIDSSEGAITENHIFLNNPVHVSKIIMVINSINAPRHRSSFDKDLLKDGVVTVFQNTPYMSTYLLAWVIGHIKCVSMTVPLNVVNSEETQTSKSGDFQGNNGIMNSDYLQNIHLQEIPNTLQDFESLKINIENPFLGAEVPGDAGSTTLYSDGISKTDPNHLRISVWAPVGEEPHGVFALLIAQRSLAFFQKYFGIPYPLPKLDMVAIPEFAMGAMENLGLITYRKASLLQTKKSTISTKKLIAETVAHEIAHQWFGNLVTMKWWDDLWLNEGFATFAASLFMHETNLFKGVWTSFLNSDVDRGLSEDALKTTHPVQMSIRDPAEIEQVFDSISYSKGASLIRMLQAYLKDSFREGISQYLREFIFDNARTPQLWEVLGRVSNRPVSDFMGVWVLKEGFPLLVVQESGEDLVITQMRYKTDLADSEEFKQLGSGRPTGTTNDLGNLSNSGSHDNIHDSKVSDVPSDSELKVVNPSKSVSPNKEFQGWFIPIEIIAEKTTNHELKKTDKSITIKKPKKEYKINPQGQGFYRVLYKTQQIQDHINKYQTEDKLNIANDYIEFIFNNLVEPEIGLEIFHELKNDDSYEILSTVYSFINRLKSIYYDHNQNVQALNNYLRNIVEKRIEEVDLQTGGLTLEDVEKNTVIVETGVGCNEPRTIRKMLKAFNSYIKEEGITPVFNLFHDNNSDSFEKDSKQENGTNNISDSNKNSFSHAHLRLHPAFKKAMFTAATKTGEEEPFNILYTKYTNLINDDEKVAILSALGQTKNKKCIQELIRKIETDDIKKQDKIYLFSSLATNTASRDTIITYLINNYKRIQDMYNGNTTLLGYVIERVFGTVSSQPLYDQVKTFLSNIDQTGIDRAVGRTLERIEIRYRFRQANHSF